MDLRSGYHHIKLDEPSSDLTTFITESGCYKWKRLPFGLSVSSEIFQKRLQAALHGLDGIVCVADDIICYGADENEHETHLRNFLERCQKVGIRLNLEKCHLREEKISFLGHEVSKDGVRPDPEKVRAISALPPPANKTEVQSLQGMINYLGKFLPNLSREMEPIRQLMGEGVKFEWTALQQEAFDRIKEMITKAPVLSFYDPMKPLVIQCDASERGLGSVMLQDGRPIAFKSRSLSECESRYATIEKEMLAIVWSLEKFHQYTYGRDVIIHSDHKPLEAIIKKPLDKAPRRLQNLLLRALNYNFTINWQKGSSQLIADLLSRASMPKEEGEETETINMSKHLPMREEKIMRFREESEKDEVQQELKKVITTGWPDSLGESPMLTIPYYHFRDELSVQESLIFRGERLVVPKHMRKEMLEEIHRGHGGEQACLRRARESVYWPAMNGDIKNYVATCEVCRTFEVSNQKETMIPHEVPERPWEKVGVDSFYWKGTEYLVIVDYFSNFWEMEKLERNTTTEVVRVLKKNFSRYGIPNIMISDNASTFTSVEFKYFTKLWDIEHRTISPRHSQSNGMVESAVKNAKKLLKKAWKANQDVHLAILNYRNTPDAIMQLSPAQRMLNRRTRTLLPMVTSLLTKRSKGEEEMKLQEKQNRMKRKHDKNAKDLSVMEEGQVIRMKPYVLGEKEWKKGIVMRRLDERSYDVCTEDGEIFRRNRKFLKPTRETMDGSDKSTRGRKSLEIPEIREMPLEKKESKTPVKLQKSKSNLDAKEKEIKMIPREENEANTKKLRNPAKEKEVEITAREKNEKTPAKTQSAPTKLKTISVDKAARYNVPEMQDPKIKNGESTAKKVMESPLKTRAGRVRKMPSYLKDYKI